jgi:hypothetical protein
MKKKAIITCYFNHDTLKGNTVLSLCVIKNVGSLLRKEQINLYFMIDNADSMHTVYAII